ncbi:MAG: ABC transporter ATP-binding protein [Limnochordaceae bacterium]|nr:ABC transporter ATP-binding protein [Limnochordaceae bacterium]
MNAATTARPADAAEREFIRLENLGKTYYTLREPVEALSGVTLTIRQREMIMVMGPSGSGKTTFLHLLGALDRPTAGSYLLEGVDMTRLSDTQLSRVRNRHFGFVFQSYNLFPELTAVENVEVPMIYGGVPRRQRRERAVQLLQQLGLGHRLKHRPSELSGGEQQRVAIARALANGPTLLLADEPTGNLPTGQGEAIMQILRDLNEHGMTIVVVTHNPEVARYGRRLILLRDGRVVGDHDVASASSVDTILRQVMADTAGVAPGPVPAQEGEAV